MSEGTKALLSIKYNVLHEGAEMKVKELQNTDYDQREYNDANNLLAHADNKCKLLNRINACLLLKK